MLDFKAELAKFSPLPENKDVPKAVNTTGIEDVADILKDLKRKCKE